MIELFKSFNNDNLKKITNVYQLKYKNFGSLGIGDYLRGSFTLLQVIQYINLYSGKNIIFDMDIRNHPISEYIISNNNDSINYDELNMYSNKHDALLTKESITTYPYNYVKDFIYSLNNLDPSITNYCAFFCSFEVIDVSSVEHGKVIKSKLQPNIEMKKYIDEVMMELGITKHSYNVIHIRCLDDVSFENEHNISDSYIQKIEKYVKKNITIEQKYLLISNNNLLKSHLINNFKNIFTYFNKIVHLADGETQNNNSTKDTLLDLYLIGYSNNVTAFSSYVHGTGFSKEICKVFNIPYSYTYIPISDEYESSNKLLLDNILFKIKKIFFYIFIIIILLVFLYVTNIVNRKKIKKWFDIFLKHI